MKEKVKERVPTNIIKWMVGSLLLAIFTYAFLLIRERDFKPAEFYLGRTAAELDLMFGTPSKYTLARSDRSWDAMYRVENGWGLDQWLVVDFDSNQRVIADFYYIE